MRAVLVILAVLCVWSGPAAAQDGTEDLKAGLVLVQAGRFEEARTRLSAALESQWLSPQQRGLAHLLRGISNLALSDGEAARVDLDQAARLLKDAGAALYLRAPLAWAMGDKDVAYEDVLRLAREYPDDLNQIDLSLIWRLWHWLKEEKRGGDQFTLLEAVIKAGYQPQDPGKRVDGLVQEYIGMLIDSGKTDQALPLVDRIVSTDLLIEMRVNGRFKPLWDDRGFEARTRPRPAAQRDLTYWKDQAAKHPKSLSIVVGRMQVLRMLGNPDAAIEMGRATLKNAEAYEKNEEARLWVMNELAYALQDAGRAGEADALLKPLLDRSIEKQPFVVSQLINYGTILMEIGEDERALAAVDKAKGRVSPFGRKWIDSVTACANHRLGRAAAEESAMKRLKTKPEENYSALSYALLCLGRVDETVQLTLVRLSDADRRDSMLMSLQAYRDRLNMSPLERDLKKRWSELRSRPEVVAEAKEHGRLLDIPLYPAYWGSY